MKPNASALDPEQLLDHAEWLRALAMRLVHGEEGADDLAQETWLRALSRPPRDPSSPRAWLATIARRIAFDRTRAEATRKQRERAVARCEEQPSTTETLERLGLQRELLDSVLALAEPYREVILLRYVHDLPPREIAERQGLPLATVKSRLQRGLAQLRLRLDERHGNDGSWRSLFLPLLTWVPERSSATTSLGTLASIGVLAMNGKILAAAFIMLVATVFWVATSTSRSVALEEGLPAEKEVSSKVLEEASVVRVESAKEVVRDERASSSETEPSQDEQNMFRLRVVRHGTREAVPFAKVLCFDPKALSSELFDLAMAQVHTPRETFGEVGIRYETDAQGEVRLPRIPMGRVLARSDRWFGLLDLHPELEAKDLTLEIRERPVAVVRVRDREGSPVANVPVAIDAGGRIGPYAAWRGHTDEVGEVEAEAIDITADVELDDLRVALAFPHEPRVEARWNGREGEPVELELPETGTLRVTVRGPGGEFVDEHAHVTAVLAALRSETHQRPGDHHDPRVLEKGVAFYPHVGVGTKLFVRVDFHLPELADLETTIDGPRFAGDAVEVTLDTQEQHLLTARILDADGKVLTDTKLIVEWLSLANPTPQSQTLAVTTDADGRCRFEVEREGHASEPRILRLKTLETVNPSSPHSSQWLDVDFRERQHLGSGDLGTLRLGTSPVLVRGRVVDETGAPEEGVDIGLLVREEPWDLGYTWDRTRSGEDGAFELRGAKPLGSLFLGAAKEGHVEIEAEAVDPFDFQVVLTLRRGVVPRGRLLVDPGIAFSALDVFAKRGAEEARGYVDSEGAYSLPALVPGTWTFSVLAAAPHGSAEELARIEDVILTPGTPIDPRAEVIDLRGRLRALSVHVEDADGGSVRGMPIQVFAQTAEDVVPLHLFVDSKGNAQVVHLRPAERYLLIPPRRRAVLVTSSEHPVDVELEPPLGVRLVLGDRTGLPADLSSVRVSLTLKTGPAAGRVLRSAPLDPNSLAATVDLPLPGRYELSWFSWNEGEGTSVILGETTVDVEDRGSPDDPQVIHFSNEWRR